MTEQEERDIPAALFFSSFGRHPSDKRPDPSRAGIAQVDS